MNLYTIADPHLSFGVDKPMDIFGQVWENHAQKIRDNWPLEKEDTIVLAGDISWAMNFGELRDDFRFLDNLKGRKFILKGNHDYWWTTLKKMNDFCKDYPSIKFIHNNAYEYNGIYICGTRGWLLEPGDENDEKVINREAGRLRSSLNVCRNSASGREPYVFLHYPPVLGISRSEDIIQILHDYNVKKCFYGHLHGSVAHKAAVSGEFEGIDMRLISADYLDFKPYRVL